jgi:GTPase SAR1 family protein
MEKELNHWAARFEPLLDQSVIKQRAQVTVPPLVNLTSMPIDLACKRLEMALETIFHPTTQCLATLHKIVGIAHAHCVVTYPNVKQFLSGVYAQESPLPNFSPPICLTGLGGVGKSKLIEAFRRIQLPDQEVVVDTEHSSFPLSGSWAATIQARSSPKDVLKVLAGVDGSPSDLIKRCRKLGYRDGIPFILADEFQFATGTNSANTRVTQMLLSLGYIGIPFLFAANYSLLYRLQKRPEEEQQRLLSNCIVLSPDAWNSSDWVDTLKAQCIVAPDYIKLDLDSDAKEFHAYSAGRKRAMAKLILIAFRNEYANGGVVDRRAIRIAYESIDYERFKDQAEMLAAQAIQNRQQNNRKDLWCPIPTELTKAQEFFESSINSRQDRVAKAELESTLTLNERRNVQAIGHGNSHMNKTSGKVVSITNKNILTAEDLKQNTNLYRENI